MEFIEKDEITWDGTNTASVVDFCIKYSKGMFSTLCGCIVLCKNGKSICGGILKDDGKLYSAYPHLFGNDPYEIPTDADLLCIEATDTMRGSDFYIRLGETVETYDDKDGYPLIKIKKELPDA